MVTSIDRESADVLSLTVQSADGHPLPMALPGQYVVVRLKPAAGGPTIFRSYSLSGPLSTERYRISVKIEPNGAAGNYLREHLRVGDRLDVSSPRGSFVLQSGERPIVLLSAGIGATPVLAMLHALAGAHSTRQVLWLHTARDGQHHPFAGEVRRLMRALTNGRSYVCYTRPDSIDKTGEDFDATGRFSQSVFDELGLPRDADVYLCGPTRFMADMREALTALGVAPERIHIEIFNGGESMTPGVVGAVAQSPHLPSDEASTGPLVSFARSGISAHWNASGTGASSKWPRRVMSRSVGRVEPAFVTTVRVAWFRGRSSTDRSHSTSRPMATFSSAVHSRRAMSSSICEATASGFTARMVSRS